MYGTQIYIVSPQDECCVLLSFQPDQKNLSEFMIDEAKRTQTRDDKPDLSVTCKPCLKFLKSMFYCFMLIFSCPSDYITIENNNLIIQIGP